MDFLDPQRLLTGELDDRTLRGLVRIGLAKLLAERDRQDAAARSSRMAELLRQLRESPTAVHAEAANVQHYDVPVAFFRLVLGRRLKYSACYWPPGVESLDAAEEAALRLVCERALIENGQRVLDLGCGWGAFALYAAERFPQTRITALTNSETQRSFVAHEATRRGLGNVAVVRADATSYEPGRRFDRIVSIEMLEHVRNYESFMGTLASWLEPTGRLFVHVFSHARHAYLFEDDWIARHFFTGGIMPSHDLLFQFREHLEVEDDWQLAGRHYQRTAEAWLENLDRGRDAALTILTDTYGAAAAAERLAMWRLFFIVCSESFGFKGGEEWMVSHYRFGRTRRPMRYSVPRALVALANQVLIRSASPPAERIADQEAVLGRILALARGSAFSLKYGLDDARSIRDYQSRVPLLHYQDLEPLWARAVQGERDVVSREPVLRFALSSGTTGRAKLIPLTASFLRTFRRQQLAALAHYLRSAPRSRILLTKGLAITGRARIGVTPGGLPFGMISGTAIETANPLLRLRGLPSLETLNTEDWDRKLDLMVAEASRSQVGFLLGIPSAVLAFLTRARQAMPRAAFGAFAAGVEVVFSSGVDYRLYREAIAAVLRRPVAFVNLYISSEGMLGLQSEAMPDAFQLHLQDFFFEFVPTDDYLAERYSRRLVVDACEPGADYVLLLTNGSGAFSYVIGDVVTCAQGGARPLFKLAGRTQLTLNAVTEKTTYAALEKALLDVARELGAAPREFFVTARVAEGRPHYVWAIQETPQWRPSEAQTIARRLDEALVKHNPHYGHFVNGQLGPSQVVFLSEAALDDWLAGRGGQQGHRKVPRVVNDFESVAKLLGLH